MNPSVSFIAPFLNVSSNRLRFSVGSCDEWYQKGFPSPNKSFG